MTVNFFASLVLFSIFFVALYSVRVFVLAMFYFFAFFVCIIFYSFFLAFLKAHWRPRLCKWQCVVVSRTMWGPRSQKFIYTC